MCSPHPPENDPRWRSVLERDPAADGRFVYAVRSTGVFCRPSCPSRRPAPGRVAFFANGAEAEAAGFRPCRRCRPDEPAQSFAAQIEEACRRIDLGATPPRLAALARAAGMSPAHFHRRFKEVTGLTPADYGAARRAERMRRALSKSSVAITQAIYESGYASNSRFYEGAEERLGMTPTAFRNGGERAEIRFALGECSLGAILVAQSRKGVCAILLGDDPQALARELQDLFPRAELIGDDPGFAATAAAAIAFVDAPRLGLALPLDLQGTLFQERVWQALQAIPPGETVSYAELAARIGRPGASRAVAGACAANRIAVAVPCHRVVRADGSLSGYRWGVERKRRLLEREAPSGRGAEETRGD